MRIPDAPHPVADGHPDVSFDGTETRGSLSQYTAEHWMHLQIRYELSEALREHRKSVAPCTTKEQRARCVRSEPELAYCRQKRSANPLFV